MVSAACSAGENPYLDLVQSYSVHSTCGGLVYLLGQDEPEPCSCPHHAMPTGPAPRHRMSWRAKGRLVLALAVALLVLWAWLR